MMLLLHTYTIAMVHLDGEDGNRLLSNCQGRVRVLFPERYKLLAKCYNLQIYSKYLFTLFIYLSNVNI